jgi:hypothetical protein
MGVRTQYVWTFLTVGTVLGRLPNHRPFYSSILLYEVLYMYILHTTW